MFSKYVGFIHYQRVFNFKNNIPDLDKIFTQYDVIINRKGKFNINLKTQYKFVFGVLLEFDRRHNLKNDDEIKNFIKSEIKNSGKITNEDYQYRQEGFLMERISCIFYDYEFKKQFQIGVTEQ